MYKSILKIHIHILLRRKVCLYKLKELCANPTPNHWYRTRSKENLAEAKGGCFWTFGLLFFRSYEFRIVQDPLFQCQELSLLQQPQHLFRCIFSTPEAILVVVNPKDAADSIGFVQSIHLEMPQGRCYGMANGPTAPKDHTRRDFFLVLPIQNLQYPKPLRHGSICAISCHNVQQLFTKLK